MSSGPKTQSPYFPGNVQIINATVLQTVQIGDDVAAPIDLLNIYMNTTIGSVANLRNLVVHGTITGGANVSPKVEEHFTGTGIDPKWTITVNGAGAVVVQVGAASIAGGVVRLTDPGIAGINDAQLSLGTNRFASKALRYSMEARLRVNVVAAANGTSIRVVLWNNGVFGAVGDWIGFEFHAVTNPNWRMRATVGGGAVVNLDTAVPVIGTQWYTLRIVTTPAGGTDFYIDDILIGSINNAGTTAVLLEPLVYVGDDGVALGAAINLDVDYVNVWPV